MEAVPGEPGRAHQWTASPAGRRNARSSRIDVETGIAFTEHDERRAVARFRRLRARRSGDTLEVLSVPIEDFPSHDDASDQHLPAADNGATLRCRRDGGHNLAFNVDRTLLWQWVRDQLLTQPQQVAEWTGLPELERFADLVPRPPSATFTKLIGHDLKNEDVTPRERRRIERIWKHFVAWLTKHDVKKRRELTHALERGEDADNLQHALTCCRALKKPKGPTRKDPEDPDEPLGLREKNVRIKEGVEGLFIEKNSSRVSAPPHAHGPRRVPVGHGSLRPGAGGAAGGVRPPGADPIRSFT